MSKILKITIEYDDKIMVAEGKEAEKWESDLNEVNKFLHDLDENLKYFRKIKKLNWKTIELHPQK